MSKEGVTSTVEEAPVYADRAAGEVFTSAREMVDRYIARYGERIGTPLSKLDESGYTQVRRGSASIGINVLEEHGVLMFLAPVMPVPKGRREELYRRLLELSFLTTSDAAFAIDRERDEIYVRALRRLSGLDYEEFEDLLDTVSRVTDQWDDALRKEFSDASR